MRAPMRRKVQLQKVGNVEGELMASQNIVFPGELQSAGANPSKVSCLYPKLDGAKQSWIGFNQHQAHELPSVHPQVDHGRTAMSVETRMAIEHSTPMPQCSGSGVNVRYKTKVFSRWDRKASAEIAHACVYEIAWIPELQCWRSFLCSVNKLG